MMKQIKHYIIVLTIVILGMPVQVMAQDNGPKQLTKEQVLKMTTEELSALPLEELMQAIDVVGVTSLDELYALLLNKGVTSASKTEESLFDSPLSTTVLSYDEMIASGATSIEEALRLVPGIIVREKTNGNYDVHIRGNDNLPAKNMMLYSENSNTLVMIDGRPVFNYSHGGTLWETLPVSFEDIDRIEVVRGPSSALYGPNAVSGVINIITQGITAESPLVTGNAQSGSLGTNIGDIAFRKAINDKVSFGVTGNYEVRERETDEIFVYNSEGTYFFDQDDTKPAADGYYSLDEARRLYKKSLMPGKYFKLWPEKGENIYAVYDIDDAFTNPGQAKEKMGVNGYFNFQPNSYTKFALSGGFQKSDVLTSTMGDMPSPYAGKVSNTGYVNLTGQIKSLNFQLNYNGGTTDFMTGNEGFELDMEQFQGTVDYQYRWKKLEVRPGVSYQSISYDDSKHISMDGRGYLNQKREITILAGSMRLDYRPTDNLRFVAALRAEKYNNPEDIYGSWQFIGSYKINDNNIFRAVYSRANQSAFLLNTYSDYTWHIVNRDYPRVIQFDGVPDHDLKTMDMFEIGYRTRPVKNLLVDVEAFYNVSENYGALMPGYSNVQIFNAAQVLQKIAAPIYKPDSVNISYYGFEMTSKQMGASVSIDWVASEKLVVKAHATVQQTKLDDYMDKSRDNVIEHQVGDAITSKINELGYQLASGELTMDQIPAVVVGESTSMPTDLKSDYTHKATPSVWGSLSLMYRPIKKLEIYPQAYFYGEQTFENQYGTEKVDAKFLLNAKVSYKVTPTLTFFLNGRNILNTDSREFAYMDEIGGLYLVGASFKF